MSLDDLKPVVPPAPQAPPWLITFTDFLGVMLCFFLVMFSMKSVNTKGWEDMTGSLSGVFAVRKAAKYVEPEGFGNAQSISISQQDGLPYLDSLLRRRVAKDPVWANLRGGVSVGGDQLVYRIPDAVFAPNATVDQAVVERLGGILRNWDNTLVLRVGLRQDAYNPKQREAALQRAGMLASAMSQRGIPLAQMTVNGMLDLGKFELVVKGRGL